jgi:D-alanyl-D-alanine dipeptidase
MTKDDVYKLLEGKMPGYKDYAGIPVRDSSEAFMPVPDSPGLCARQIDEAMFAYTGRRVFVREGVLKRLLKAARLLARQCQGLRLEVVYGYRSLEIQERLFTHYRNELRDRYSGEELMEAVHRLVAVPEVAGHPAGAAVDVQILKDGSPLDFGTKVHEFVPDTFTFSPFIGRQAWDNRQLLRRVMTSAGFAPFDGEWWHFSYGDKEWAYYYRKGRALYGQTLFSCIDTENPETPR